MFSPCTFAGGVCYMAHLRKSDLNLCRFASLDWVGKSCLSIESWPWTPGRGGMVHRSSTWAGITL